ncbi:MAG: peptidoglycan DD-metalloendopeptidase family protein [Bacteroidota bacterium]
MRFFKLTFLILCVLSGTVTFAQSNRKEELQKQKIELQKEISYVNTLLDENKKASKYSVAQVRNIATKINIREGLIDNIGREIVFIEKNIKDKQIQTVELESELVDLKADYARIILQTYKSSSSYNRILFLLSSDNFNQALKRLKYMEQYTRYRKEQGDKIEKHSTKLAATIEKLKQEKKDKLSLITSKEEEKSSLESEKVQKENVLGGLKRKNKKLLSEIRSKQKKSNALQSEIQKIIMEEIRLSREKARKENKADNSGVKFELTAEAKALADNFKLNKDKLPWPVERGVVVSRYGKHPHPTMKNIIIVNHGVDIATEKGSVARAIFDGEVSSVILSKGGAKTILVQHGNYYTVYSNLSKIYVKKGQKVSTKQKIGEVYTNSRTGDTVLKFQLWYDKNEQNPASWIYRM